jgi:hypothetical protein
LRLAGHGNDFEKTVLPCVSLFEDVGDRLELQDIFKGRRIQLLETRFGFESPKGHQIVGDDSVIENISYSVQGFMISGS